MRPWFPPEFDADGRPAARGEHPDRVIATLAALQHRTITRPQLLYTGITARQIERRVQSGHLHVLHRGVYAAGCRTLTPAGLRMGGLLSAGPGAVLAGWSGCTQRTLLPDAGTRVDVLIPHGRHVTRPGVAVRNAAIRPSEVSVADGIPTLSVARLLLDLARVHDADVTEWAWRQAIFLKQLDIREVQAVLGDHDGEPGTPILRGLCDRRAELVGTVRNRFELRMLAIIREAGLPEPRCNMPLEVAPGIVLRPDFHIPQLRLVLESDGRDGHADVEFQFTDGERDAFYRALGHTVMRYGYWEAKRERRRIAGELRDYGATFPQAM